MGVTPPSPECCASRSPCAGPVIGRSPQSMLLARRYALERRSALAKACSGRVRSKGGARKVGHPTGVRERLGRLCQGAQITGKGVGKPHEGRSAEWRPVADPRPPMRSPDGARSLRGPEDPHRRARSIALETMDFEPAGARTAHAAGS